MQSFFHKFINKLRTFFYGRNGFDDLAKHTLIVSLVVFLVYGFWPNRTFTNQAIKFIIGLISYSLIGYSYFRVFSKNVFKRVQENKRYVGFIKMNKTRWQQRKTHKFYRCPKCKTWLRVPKGHGKITITCVKCSTKFDKRT